jgi:hypothetical protein
MTPREKSWFGSYKADRTRRIKVHAVTLLTGAWIMLPWLVLTSLCYKIHLNLPTHHLWSTRLEIWLLKLSSKYTTDLGSRTSIRVFEYIHRGLHIILIAAKEVVSKIKIVFLSVTALTRQLCSQNPSSSVFNSKFKWFSYYYENHPAIAGWRPDHAFFDIWSTAIAKTRSPSQ